MMIWSYDDMIQIMVWSYMMIWRGGTDTADWPVLISPPTLLALRVLLAVLWYDDLIIRSYDHMIIWSYDDRPLIWLNPGWLTRSYIASNFSCPPGSSCRPNRPSWGSHHLPHDVMQCEEKPMWCRPIRFSYPSSSSLYRRHSLGWWVRGF